MEQINEYILTDDEKGMIQPLMETATQVQNETQSVLRAIIRLRKLEGDWTLQGDKLLKVHTNGSGGK
jgi:hypothetical protein